MENSRRLAWTEVDRTRFHDRWDRLAPLTVLVTMPGWGRTVWLRQCLARIIANDPSTSIAVADDRATAIALLAPGGPSVLAIDGVDPAADDPLWASIGDALRAEPDRRVLVAAAESPAPGLVDGIRRWALDERDLRLDDDELDRLLVANGVELAPDVRHELTDRLGGAPSLVRRQIERVGARASAGVWASPAFAAEREHVSAVLGAGDHGSLARLLRAGAGLRRFAAKTVTEDPQELDAFARLEAIPLGRLDADDETGRLEFVWTPAAWTAIANELGAASHSDRMRAALPGMRERGSVSTTLFTLLALGDLDAAETLVSDEFRRLLIFTDEHAQGALLALAPEQIGARPGLLLLASELRLRTTGANPVSVRCAAAAAELLQRRLAQADPGGVRDAALLAMSAAIAGRRSVAHGALAIVAAMLGEVTDADASTLFPAFWAAIQTDHHDLAFRIARAMSAIGDLGCTIARIDRITAITEEDFAGVRSLDPEAHRPDDLHYSQLAAFVLLEEGADAEALDRSRQLEPRVHPAPTRSAPDALLLLTRAVVDPVGVASGTVREIVDRSMRSWDDGRPSSFIALAAVGAHLAAGRVAEARHVVGSIDGVDDWFSLVATALVARAAGDEAGALRRLDAAAGRTGLPRLVVVEAVLGAAVIAALGHAEASAERLIGAWRRHPAPRLLRFALRLCSEADLTRFAALQHRLPAALRSALAASIGDRRSIGAPRRPVPTAVELEILGLLREGRSNAEIAERRGVSANTVRTQLRLLYRKFGVDDRAAVVALAERERLLQDP